MARRAMANRQPPPWPPYLHRVESGIKTGGESKSRTPIRVRADTGIAGTVFTTGRALNIPDAYADPRIIGPGV